MKRFGLLISVLMLVVALSIYVGVRLSLPLTEGEISLQKLTNTVVVERDSLGVPTVRGSDRLDVARATGFLHAQDRCALSPGKEAEGYFHTPGGQSGHPLSPFYHAGHSAWVRGEPLPFLPGETKHILTLNP